MKITKRQLRRIIKEEGYYSKLPKWHIDGHAWPGSLEDLAHEQSRAWGHGNVVDKKGFKSQIKKSVRLATGTDSSPLRLSERQLRRIIREAIPRGGAPDVVGAITSSDPKAERLQHLINGWITQPITVEFVRGTSYMVKGIEPAMIPEVTEEVEEFGGSVVAEISSGTTPGLKDLNITL